MESGHISPPVTPPNLPPRRLSIRFCGNFSSCPVSASVSRLWPILTLAARSIDAHLSTHQLINPRPTAGDTAEPALLSLALLPANEVTPSRFPIIKPSFLSAPHSVHFGVNPPRRRPLLEEGPLVRPIRRRCLLQIFLLPLFFPPPVPQTTICTKPTRCRPITPSLAYALPRVQLLPSS